MKNILFLVHRIPYPPNKGDKIRSFNILKHLARQNRVYLGSFIDDPDDHRHIDEVGKFCADLCIVSVNPFMQRIRSLQGFVSGGALTKPYYANRRLGAWVRQTIAATSIDAVLVFSSSMGQYLDDLPLRDKQVVIDFVDVDSEKWRQYAQQKSWPLSWIYQREGKTLAEEESRLSRLAAHATFVSEDEAALFTRLFPEHATKCSSVPNGCDTEYFDPEISFDNPYPPDSKPIAFTGAMDYWANEDAVQRFVQKVWPALRQQEPTAVFYIVGARPTPGVRKLGKTPGIVVTGSVADMRPYLAHCAVSVAPMHIARGVQNKVLEALAMARPVVASPQAAEGIEGVEDVVSICSGVEEAIRKITEILCASGKIHNQAGRELVLDKYSWQANMSLFDALLTHDSSTATASSDWNSASLENTEQKGLRDAG